MLTGVCKTVDAIMLPCRSCINFGNSNGWLHACNLLVITAWRWRRVVFFVINSLVPKIIIFSIFASTNKMILHKR